MTSAAPAGIAKRGSIPEAFAAEGAAEKTSPDLQHMPPVGVSLLAIASAHPTLK